MFISKNIEKINTILKAFLFNILWLFFIKFFLFFIYSEDLVKILSKDLSNIKSVIFENCFLAPIWEEFVFRVFPLTVILSLNKKNKEELLIPTIIFTSIIFGLAHGNPMNILIQSAGGVIMSYIYLEYRSYMWCVIYHSFWNFFFIILSLFLK